MSTLTLSRPRTAYVSERLVLDRLRRIERGRLEVLTSEERHVFGVRAPDGLSGQVRVTSPEVWAQVLLGGSIGAGEAYMDGHWTSDDLVSVLRVFARDARVLGGLELGAARLGQTAARVYQRLRPNTRSGGRANIRAHYDLGNDFFSRMLDPTLAYSSAIFPRPDATLEEGSREKFRLLCDLLELGPGDHLLEIGTGWGGLAVYAAKERGARVTTTTISAEQHRFASELVRREGLAGRVEVLDADYRDLRGTYDKIVSVEMIEAVGAEYYGIYFERLDRLLRPGGRAAIQAITLPDHEFERALGESDFIKRYIFPGSAIPSVAALLEASSRRSALSLEHLREFGEHYARTLACWRDNLAPHRAWVVARYGERFWRMWSYYLAYCEAGFRERYIGLAQLLFRKRG